MIQYSTDRKFSEFRNEKFEKNRCWYLVPQYLVNLANLFIYTNEKSKDRQEVAIYGMKVEFK